MGNPLRMKIMHLLRDRPMNVNDIASITHTSGHRFQKLTVLRNAGIVMAHREGTNIIYQVANPKIMSVCDMMRDVLTEQIGERSKLMDETNE